MRFMSLRQPMSLIITEDNSNLVSSPIKSFNLFGKKFPSDYEKYSIWRFRKYNFQLLISAIAFCALFICGLYISNFTTTNINYPRVQYEVDLSTSNAKYSDELIDKLYAIDGITNIVPTGDSTPSSETDSTSDGSSSSSSSTSNKETTSSNSTSSNSSTSTNSSSSSTTDTTKTSETTSSSQSTDETTSSLTVGDEEEETDEEDVIDSTVTPTIEALYIRSHILINKNDVSSGSFVVFKDHNSGDQNVPEDGDYRATNEVLYNAVILEDQVKKLEENYEIEGDPEQVLTDDNAIIIGDSISNLKKFDFEPGDKISVATYLSMTTRVDSNSTGKTLLKNQIKNFSYKYTEFTICAVIKDIPCGSTPIYFNSSAYKAVTGKSATCNMVNIYVDDSLSNDELTSIASQIKNIGYDNYSGYLKITNERATTSRNISIDKHYPELVQWISYLILLISPLIWFFSQTLYYRKREKEFNIIQSMGAVGTDIKKIYIIGGLSMSVLSFMFSIGLSYLASYLLYLIYNAWIPSFTGEYVRFTFDMPIYALIISIVMSVACGFFSAYIPCRNYFKYRYSLENGGAGSADDE